MGTLYRNGVPYIGSGGAGGVELTEAEYEALPSSEKMNGTIYFITDGSVSYPTASEMRYDNTESQIPATSVQGAIDENRIEINELKNGLTKLFGSGSGSANSLCYREEITAITAEMWQSISNGDFSKVHVGMHYTAPSGRKYWFADANYFKQHGDSEITFNHMLVVEDECQATAQHQTTNITTGGATDSLLYTTYLPAHQSELEADFGASHIKEARLLLSNAVSNGVPSGWAWAGKKSFLLNMSMVFGHYLQYSGNTGEMFNGGNRVRQAALFRAMPEAILSRLAATQARQWYWLDDVASAATFAAVTADGGALSVSASSAGVVRRAFIIG